MLTANINDIKELMKKDLLQTITTSFEDPINEDFEIEAEHFKVMNLQEIKDLSVLAIIDPLNVKES